MPLSGPYSDFQNRIVLTGLLCKYALSGSDTDSITGWLSSLHCRSFWMWSRLHPPIVWENFFKVVVHDWPLNIYACTVVVQQFPKDTYTVACVSKLKVGLQDPNFHISQCGFVNFSTLETVDWFQTLI